MNGLRARSRWPYAAIAIAAIQVALSYRGARLMHLATSLIYLAVQYALWSNVFSRTASAGGYTWIDMQAYVLIGFVLAGLLTPSTEQLLIGEVRGGDIAHQLVRPIDPIAASFSVAVGIGGLELFVALGVATIAGLLAFEIEIPELRSLASFVLSSALAFVVKFLISYLTVLISFRTLNVTGLIWTKTAVTLLLSGMILPIDLFPLFFQGVLRALPFRDTHATPLAIYLGRVAEADILPSLGRQLAWALILYALCRWLWRVNIRRLEIQGG